MNTGYTYQIFTLPYRICKTKGHIFIVSFKHCSIPTDDFYTNIKLAPNEIEPRFFKQDLRFESHEWKKCGWKMTIH